MAALEVEYTAEVHFAQKLAANDKTLRDRALRRLKKWIAAKSASTKDFTKDDMLHLWKGLFYCMWMSDKPLIQEDLAQSISNLIRYFKSTNSVMSFIEGFYITMGREWFGIDRWRMNKFEFFVRKFVNASFECLKRKEWDEKLVNALINALKSVAIKCHDNIEGFPLSLQLHIAEVYVEEFARVSEDEVPMDIKLKIIEPYLRLLVQTKNDLLREQIDDKIFRLIMRISEVGLPKLKNTSVESEYEEEESNDVADNKRSEENESGKDSLDENDMEIEETDIKKKRKKKKSTIKKHSYAKLFRENEKNDLKIPYLNFDYLAIADMLVKFGSTKGVRRPNRQNAYDLAKKFRLLANGIYPLVIKMPDSGSDLDDSDLEAAVGRLQREMEQESDDLDYDDEDSDEEEEYTEVKKKTKKPQSESKMDDLSEDKYSKKNPKGKKMKLEVDALSQSIVTSKKKQKKKLRSKKQKEIESESEDDSGNNRSIKKTRKKRRHN